MHGSEFGVGEVTDCVGDVTPIQTLSQEATPTSTSLPVQYIESGMLTCGPPRQPGDSKYFMTLDGASGAINALCDQMLESKPVFGEGGTKYQAIEDTPSDSMDNPISVTATWVGGGPCGILDFGMEDPSFQAQLCWDTLNVIVNNCKCNRDSDYFSWRIPY